MHEGGISTPLIVRWPGVVQPNTFADEVGHVIDLMATCADVGGATYLHRFGGNEVLPLEGRSLVPVLQGAQVQPHETLCWEWSGNRAIRQGDWKLVWDKQVKQWELYDLAADRTETHDLAAEHPHRVAQMSNQWHAWAKRTTVR